MWIALADCRRGDVFEYTLDGRIGLALDNGVFVDEHGDVITETGVWVKVLRDKPIIPALNTESKVVHLTLSGGRPLCGNRHSQNSITDPNLNVSCKKCIAYGIAYYEL